MKSNKGISLVVLVITIIVLVILTVISIDIGYEVIEDVREEKQITELEIIQHAIQEKYTKYKITKNENILVGTKMQYSETLAVINEINKKNTHNPIIIKIFLKSYFIDKENASNGKTKAENIIDIVRRNNLKNECPTA